MGVGVGISGAVKTIGVGSGVPSTTREGEGVAQPTTKIERNERNARTRINLSIDASWSTKNEKYYGLASLQYSKIDSVITIYVFIE